jgi:hypothetical protein
MDEVSAQATLTDAEVDPRLAVSVPKSEIERALEAKDDVDLLLDVIRTNGEREERRVSLAWDRDALERLAQQEGERVIIAIDPDSLQAAFDDVEAHGMREMGATLAIVVATGDGGHVRLGGVRLRSTGDAERRGCRPSGGNREHPRRAGGTRSGIRHSGRDRERPGGTGGTGSGA